MNAPKDTSAISIAAEISEEDHALSRGETWLLLAALSSLAASILTFPLSL